MEVIGTVVTIEMNVQIAKRNGGSYVGSRLSYRDETGALKEQAFTAQTLKYNAGVNSALNNLKPGDRFTMVKEKEGDFWNVKSISVGGSASSAPVPSSAKPNASPKPTYETPEERAARQVMIVRQSSISSAVAALKLDKAALDANAVIAMAKAFEAYVMGKGEEVGHDDVDTFADMDDDMPV